MWLLRLGRLLWVTCHYFSEWLLIIFGKEILADGTCPFRTWRKGFGAINSHWEPTPLIVLNK